MEPRQNHISVCICTFRRPDLLLRSLKALDEQYTAGEFTYSVIVADNDCDRSAQDTVAAFSQSANIAVRYCVEPEQNIALVRNRAIAEADGEFIAFMDDDEVPEEQWLHHLYSACHRFGADGILGPVVPYFDHDPPAWVRKGKFFDRPAHPTSYELKWAECRTGNVLFRRSILPVSEPPFRAHFGAAGEDMDFFRRMIDAGFIFMWCAEAKVHELVPPARCSRSFLLKRALLRGSNFPKHPANRLKNIAKSIVAVPLYTLALPVLAACGQHLFIKYLIKLADHSARLLAFTGVPVIKERET